MRITAAMLTAVAVLLLPVTLFTVPHAREQAAPGSDADSSAFRFMEVNYSEHRVGAIRVMAPSVALPNWQRRTNVWHRVTSPARGAKRLRSGTLRTALNRGIVRKVKRGLYRWHR
jgi:hypothetical protein